MNNNAIGLIEELGFHDAIKYTTNDTEKAQPSIHEAELISLLMGELKRTKLEVQKLCVKTGYLSLPWYKRWFTKKPKG